MLFDLGAELLSNSTRGSIDNAKVTPAVDDRSDASGMIKAFETALV